MKHEDVEVNQVLWCGDDRVRVLKITGKSILICDIDDEGYTLPASKGTTLSGFLRVNKEDE